MIRESEIRQQLDAVASNQVSLFDFGDWIDSHSWNMHADSERAAVALASDILRLFAEYDLSLSEESLRQELMKLRGHVNVVRVHILIDANGISRFVAPIPASSSHPEQFPELWVPELV